MMFLMLSSENDQFKFNPVSVDTTNRYDQYDDRAEGLYDDDMMLHTINERFRVFKCMKMGLGAFRQEIAGANTYI